MHLKYWSRVKWPTFCRRNFQYALCVKIILFWFKFHFSLYLVYRMTGSRHCPRRCLVAHPIDGCTLVWDSVWYSKHSMPLRQFPVFYNLTPNWRILWYPDSVYSLSPEHFGRYFANISNTLRPRQNCHFADDIFKCIFVNKNYPLRHWAAGTRALFWLVLTNMDKYKGK